jgi:hypothetical protein
VVSLPTTLSLETPPASNPSPQNHPQTPVLTPPDALNLHLYFDEVESLSINTGLNEEGKVQHTLRYASREDNKLWSMLPEAEAQVPDYAQFCDAIIKLYPGADDERKYAESDLQRLIDTQWQYGIKSRAELRHYY